MALAVTQLPGCGGGSGDSASTGTLRVALTDKPSDEYAKVVIAIKEVRVVPVGLENAAADSARLPVIVTFGSLSGTVVTTTTDWSTAKVSVLPEGGANAAASGTIFSNFTSNRWEAPFSSVVPGGPYRLHLLADGFAPYSSPLQTVTTGSDTSLGEVVLQSR